MGMNVTMLVDFTSTNVCKDSRIFVHCWSGISGNRVAQTLIELGFTNVHAAGPEGSAGIWDWKKAGWELVYNDTFNASALQPSCIGVCPKTVAGTDSAPCTRETWSVVAPNETWTGHNFHPQVWYHTLEDIHELWKAEYFDYVLDIRPLQDFTIDNPGSPLLLDGWESFHIPGSYPINVFPPDTPAMNVTMLVDFTSTNVCKDSRIFVHCWSGISGNRVA